MPSCQKACLLTLKLSSPSFLDSVVGDDHGNPAFYAIRTTGTTTRITRSDPWDGPVEITTIKWPPTNQKSRSKNWDGLLVQIRNGDWEAGEHVLKHGSVLNSSPRRFNIPGYSKTLKWKAVGAQYWCVSPSVQGPIATLNPAVGSVPPRMKVYESLHDKYDTRPMLVHNGVSILLLDYLVITALLLVTESKDIGRLDASSAQMGTSFLSISTTSLPWTKLIQRESIFRRRSTAHVSTDNLPTSSTSSVGQMAKIVYGDPIYPSLSAESSLADSDSEEDFSTDNGDAETVTTDVGFVSHDSSMRVPSASCPGSPSQESICYPLRNTSAPSHTYIDPSFYVEPGAGTVPREDSRMSSCSSSCDQQRSIPRVSSVSSFRKLPPPPEHTKVRRPQSSPGPPSQLRRARSGSAASSVMLSSPTSETNHIRRLPTPPTHSRTLPQTPSFTACRKESHDDLSGWLLPHSNSSSSRLTVMDIPPPAYNSIDFAVPEDAPLPPIGLRPLPPAPPVPSP